MLIERGAIVREGDRWMANETISTIEIPETLHGLLLARIDQLPDDAKRSLRVASVIGRQFPVRVLESVLTTAGEE
jgi:predicted ATPase